MTYDRECNISPIDVSTLAQIIKKDKELRRGGGGKRGKTNGVLLGVFPPVGPAVPDSQSVYVLPNFPLTFFANPDTISVVGPR